MEQNKQTDNKPKRGRPRKNKNMTVTWHKYEHTPFESPMKEFKTTGGTTENTTVDLSAVTLPFYAQKYLEFHGINVSRKYVSEHIDEVVDAIEESQRDINEVDLRQIFYSLSDYRKAKALGRTDIVFRRRGKR